MSDELWDRLEPVLPQCERRSRIQAKALFNREVLRGILYALRSGTQCEYLPQDDAGPRLVGSSTRRTKTGEGPARLTPPERDHRVAVNTPLPRT